MAADDFKDEYVFGRRELVNVPGMYMDQRNVPKAPPGYLWVTNSPVPFDPKDTADHLDKWSERPIRASDVIVLEIVHSPRLLTYASFVDAGFRDARDRWHKHIGHLLSSTRIERGGGDE
jgi:hypothetical protein